MKLTSQPLGIIKLVFEHKYCILYFQIAFSNLYKAASASDKCTLYSDRNLINRRNVKSDVSSAVNACCAFFQLEVEARVVAGRGEPMSKKSRLPIPIVNSRYLPTIGRLIGKTDGHLNFFY